jgi:hypothetical protein
VKISRVLEFEVARTEPEILYPGISQDVVERHRHWLEPLHLDLGSRSYGLRVPAVITMMAPVVVLFGISKQAMAAERGGRQ